MDHENHKPGILGDALLDVIREAVRDEIRTVMAGNGSGRVTHPDEASPYLTIKQAAKLSNLGVSSIRLYVRKRELKAHQVGSRIIIKRTNLEQFLEAHPIEITPN